MTCIQSYRNSSIVVLFIDAYTIYGVCYLVKHKDEVDEMCSYILCQFYVNVLLFCISCSFTFAYNLHVFVSNDEVKISRLL